MNLTCECGRPLEPVVERAPQLAARPKCDCGRETPFLTAPVRT